MKKRLLQICLLMVGLGSLYLAYYFFSTNTLPGTATQKAENKIHLPDPKNVETDQETGLQVENNVILVTFSRFADEGTVNRIVQDIGGQIVGFEWDSNFFQVLLPDADLVKTKKICTQLLSSYKEVEYAVPNTISRADNPYWEDGNAK